MPELTGPQIAYNPTYRADISPLTYRKIRRMRKDPTIALCRQLFFAGIYLGHWSYKAEDEDEEKKLFIEEQFSPIRRHILATGALGCFDFGWQPYEKVFDVDVANSRIVLKKLKPLLQDCTTIKTDSDDTGTIGTGAFIGLESEDRRLDLEKSLLFYFDVEGTNWYGQSMLGIAEQPYDSSIVLEDAARKYDKKIAGAHWVIQYPDGKNTYNGKEYYNSEIADKILQALSASGSVALPLGQAEFQDLMQGGGWKIELISASGATVDFTNRFEYLDKLKCRALGFPERSVLEGQHGTKAEAGEHKDFVMTLIEYRHACLLELINWHCVNQLLRLNWGEEAKGTVEIKASPLDDASYAVLSRIYDAILSSPEGRMQELDLLEVGQIADTLGIPRREEDDDQPLFPVVSSRNSEESSSDLQDAEDSAVEDDVEANDA